MTLLLLERTVTALGFWVIAASGVHDGAQGPHASLAAPLAAVGQHAGHTEQKPPEKPPAPKDPPQKLPPFVPPVTDEDRKAAFPDVEGHAVHDQAVNYFVLFDQVEWRFGEDQNGLALDGEGWVGRDRDRLWFRADADTRARRLVEAGTHVLYGRQVSRWWDVVGGIRQDFRPGPARTWAAIGIQGLAPYWFEIDATAYVGASGRTQVRFKVEYELLFTNRLILQPLAELDLSGKSDPERGIGAGLSTTDLGFRLRYEFRRELAPYAGVIWNRKYGRTADFARAAGEPASAAQFVTGVRLWF
jgi:copper resistance protein B